MATNSGEETSRERNCRKSSNVRRTYEWSYRDKRLLIDAVKAHGLGDMNKIAEAVGTKAAWQIENFIDKITHKIAKKQKASVTSLNRLFSKSNRTDPVSNEQYPPIALWKKIAQGIVRTKVTETDYSSVLSDVLGDMAKEEEKHKPNNPELLDLSKCYTYLRDVLRNVMPAQLPPLESLSIMLALEEVMRIVKDKDTLFADEVQFAQDFAGPMKFVPMKECDDSEDISYKKGLKLLPFVVTPDARDEDSNDEEGETCSTNRPHKRMRMMSVNGTEAVPSCSKDGIKAEAIPERNERGATNGTVTHVAHGRDSFETGAKSETDPSASCTKSGTETADGVNKRKAAIVDVANGMLTNTRDVVKPSENGTHIKELKAMLDLVVSQGIGKDGETDHEDNGTDASTSEEDDADAMSSDSSTDDESDEQLSLPSEVFEDILRHVKVKDHLNPLVAHIYMLHNERNILKKYFDEIQLADENSQKKNHL